MRIVVVYLIISILVMPGSAIVDNEISTNGSSYYEITNLSEDDNAPEYIVEEVLHRITLNSTINSYTSRWTGSTQSDITFEIWSTGINLTLTHSSSGEQHIDKGIITGLRLFNYTIDKTDDLDIKLSLPSNADTAKSIFIIKTNVHEPVVHFQTGSSISNKSTVNLEITTNTLQFDYYVNSTLKPVNYYNPQIASEIETIYNLTVISRSDASINDITFIEFDFTPPEINLDIPDVSFIDKELEVKIYSSEPLVSRSINYDKYPISSSTDTTILIYPYFIEPGYRTIEFEFVDYAGNVKTIEYTNIFNHTDYFKPYTNTKVEYLSSFTLSWKGVYQNISYYSLQIEGTQFSSGDIESYLDFKLDHLTSQIQRYDIEFIAYSDTLTISNTFVITVNDTIKPMINSVQFLGDVNDNQRLNFTIFDVSAVYLMIVYNGLKIYDDTTQNHHVSYSIPINGWLNQMYKLKIVANDAFNKNSYELNGVWEDHQPPEFIDTPEDQVLHQSEGGRLVEWSYSDYKIINTSLYVNDTLISFEPGNITKYQFQLSRLNPGDHYIILKVEDIGGNTVFSTNLIRIIQYSARTYINESQSDHQTLLPVIIIVLVISINIKPIITHVRRKFQ